MTNPTEWDEDGYQPDPPETDVNDGTPETETAEEYGPEDTDTEPAPAPDDIPNGDDQ